jgi:autotransporter-associated beta strand protein
LTFDLSANPASGNDVITVTGTLANNGTVLISLSQLAGSLGVGTYTLMTYGSLAGNGTFALTGTYPGNVSLNVGANSLTLIVSNTAPNLVWVGDGAANNWNLTTANWLNGTTPAAFGQNNNVSFTDSGSATPNINLTTSLFPGTVTVNSSQAYTFDGSGQLSGLGLVINGSGTLILNTSNNYTNGTVINSGTVQLGNNGPAGSLAGTIINNSQLVFDHNSTNTMTNTISGTGTLTVNGSGLEILTASNTFSGGTIINAGTLQLNSLTAGGSGPIADNSSVNLLAGGFKFLNAFSGSGIINIVPAQSSYSVSNVSYDYAQFNGPLNLNATINVPFGPGVARVVTTAANLTASSVTINVTNNGELYVQTGTLAATVNLAGAGYGDGLGAIRLTGTLSGTVNLTGNATIAGPGTFSGTIGDNGNGYSLKISSRVITYSGVTSQNFGDTIINTNAGLTLINGAAVENSAAIDIGPGATFNVSADSVATYPIPTGLGDGAVAQTLASTGENGIINGNVTLGSGGSLAVTIANDGQPSLLVTNGTLTLADNPVIVTASALPLTGGTYPLVAIATNGTVGSVSGDVSASTLTIAGAGLGNGATASLLLADSVLYLVVNQPTPAPAIFGSVSPLPGNGGFQLIFSGSNGHNYSILTTTNLTLPLASWQTLATGSFGSVLVTNTDLTATNSPQRFYDILSQ